MALASILTRARQGMDAPQVHVEVHLSNGLPAFNLVGLPETSVREAKERVRSAIINAGFEFPMRRITVNLAPAEIPKQGGRYDLPIAIGILIASKQLPADVANHREFIGELNLSGDIRGCQGLLPALIAVKKTNNQIIIPLENGADNQLADYPKVALTKHLTELAAYLNQQVTLPAFVKQKPSAEKTESIIQWQDIIGQVQAKVAVEIAAAGGHNLLMIGPPGTGKTMLAKAMQHLLTPLDTKEALEVATIYSIATMDRHPVDFLKRPYRQPHHNCSSAALVGGGSVPIPGEISLAHKGVLFLDELPEFSKKVLDCLREPLETGEVFISRAQHKTSFPAQFQLVAAMNPSPCGHHQHQSRSHIEQIKRYLNRLSGPLLDRFDLSVDVPPLPAGSLSHIKKICETTEQVRLRIQAAQKKQLERQHCFNAHLSGKAIEKQQRFSHEQIQFLERTIVTMKLSVRSFHRIQRVALTIADLQQSELVERSHIAQALSFRAIDKLMHQINNH